LPHGIQHIGRVLLESSFEPPRSDPEIGQQLPEWLVHIGSLLPEKSLKLRAGMAVLYQSEQLIWRALG
jgi:hypothetical protein